VTTTVLQHLNAECLQRANLQYGRVRNARAFMQGQACLQLYWHSEEQDHSHSIWIFSML